MLFSGVVADPNLEQVAQNKDRIRGRIFHIGLPHIKRGNFFFLQMQVRNEINRAPSFWCFKHLKRQHACSHGNEEARKLKRNSLFNDDGFIGHVVMEAIAASFNAFNVIHNVVARHHMSKHCVAPALQ